MNFQVRSLVGVGVRTCVAQNVSVLNISFFLEHACMYVHACACKGLLYEWKGATSRPR